MSGNVKFPRQLSSTAINIILEVCMFIFAGMVFTESLGLSEMAGKVPKLVSALALLLCAAELYVDVKKFIAEQASQNPVEDSHKFRWYYMLIIVSVYAILLMGLGFIIATFTFLLLTPYFLNQKKWKVNFLLATVTTAILYYGFAEIFYVNLPSGLLFDYLF